MSIATLKRKTQAKYNNMSVCMPNFSLNGTLRNQGYVGQTSLSRSLPKTLMKGNVACGSGGCCGKFNKTPIVQSAVTSLNNPNVIKGSTINTMGMLENKYKWAKRPFPFSVTKPSSDNNVNSQGDHITHLAKCAIRQYNDLIKNTNSYNINNNSCCNYNPYYRQKIPNIIKSDSQYLPISSGEYIIQLDNGCIRNDTKYIKNTLQTPFGCNNV
jgi:hypothetical protein